MFSCSRLPSGMAMLSRTRTLNIEYCMWVCHGGRNHCTYMYRIAGNFHMVQIFTVFADRLTTAKIKTTKMLMGGENDDIIVNESHRAGAIDRFSHVRPLYLCSLWPSRRSLSICIRFNSYTHLGRLYVHYRMTCSTQKVHNVMHLTN